MTRTTIPRCTCTMIINTLFTLVFYRVFHLQQHVLLFIVGLGSDDEVKLVKHLFESQGYNPLIRPVKNLTDHVEVDFGLALIQLISVVSTYIYLYQRNV